MKEFQSEVKRGTETQELDFRRCLKMIWWLRLRPQKPLVVFIVCTCGVWVNEGVMMDSGLTLSPLHPHRSRSWFWTTVAPVKGRSRESQKSSPTWSCWASSTSAWPAYQTSPNWTNSKRQEEDGSNPETGDRSVSRRGFFIFLFLKKLFLLWSAAGAERQQDIRRSGGPGGATGQPNAPQPQREQVQRHQHPGAAGGWSLGNLWRPIRSLFKC